MNGKICLSVLIGFIFVFSTLYGINVAYPTLNEVATVEVQDKAISAYSINHPFFLQEFDPKIKKIFLLGSSQVRVLNSSLVKEIVQNENKDQLVYNLAMPGDKPSKRYKQLPHLISIEPVLVVLGLGYRDFHVDVEPFIIQEKIFPDTKQVLGKINPIKNAEMNQINPKLITTKIINSLFENDEPSKKPVRNNTIILPNTPFSPNTAKYFTEILSNEELKIRGDPKIMPKDMNIVSDFDYTEITKIKEIIKILQENEIKIIILLTPLHKDYLESIPDNEKVKFYSIVDNIVKDTGVTTYDFTDKYGDLPIWRNWTHVSYHPNSSIYSEDIAQMIISELNQ